MLEPCAVSTKVIMTPLVNSTFAIFNFCWKWLLATNLDHLRRGGRDPGWLLCLFGVWKGSRIFLSFPDDHQKSFKSQRPFSKQADPWVTPVCSPSPAVIVFLCPFVILIMRLLNGPAFWWTSPGNSLNLWVTHSLLKRGQGGERKERKGAVPWEELGEDLCGWV